MTKILVKVLPMVLAVGTVAAVVYFKAADHRWQLMLALLPFVVALGISKFVAGPFDRATSALALLIGIGCAIVASLKLGLVGAVAGGIVAFALADFLLCLVLGVLAALLAILGFQIKKDDEYHREPPSYPVRFAGGLLRLMGAALMLLVCHEMYWFVNIASDALSSSVGARIVHSTTVGDERPYLAGKLSGQRWFVAAFNVLPLEPIMQTASKTNSQTAMQLIDLTAGKAYSLAQPNWWQKMLVRRRAATDAGLTAAEKDRVPTTDATITSSQIDDDELREIGGRLRADAQDNIRRCYARTLYVRRIMPLADFLSALGQVRDDVNTLNQPAA